MLVSNDIHYKLMWASRHQKIIITFPLTCVLTHCCQTFKRKGTYCGTSVTSCNE